MRVAPIQGEPTPPGWYRVLLAFYVVWISTSVLLFLFPDQSLALFTLPPGGIGGFVAGLPLPASHLSLLDGEVQRNWVILLYTKTLFEFVLTFAALACWGFVAKPTFRPPPPQKSDRRAILLFGFVMLTVFYAGVFVLFAGRLTDIVDSDLRMAISKIGNTASLRFENSFTSYFMLETWLFAVCAALGTLFAITCARFLPRVLPPAP